MTYVHDGGILLAAFDKFSVRDPRILVLVHTPEYLVHSLGANQWVIECVREKRTFSGVSSFSGSFSIWPVIL